MTVAELIERLQGLDGNLVVCGSDYEDGAYEVEYIKIEDFRGKLRVVLT